MVLTAVFASPAAAASGQIGEAFGKPGSGTGAFVTPGMLGVDPSDGSVYTGEEKDESKYRIQKFTSSGEFKASVEVPRLSGEVVFNMRGIAVDPALDRVYVLEGCHLKKPATGCKLSSSFYGASRILVFSTEPSGTALVPASPATLAVPGSEEAIYEPQTIAVDPSSNDLVILGEDFNGHLLVQRIGSNGTPGARYVDTADELRVPGKKAESLAVGPDGTAYTLTGGPSLPGAPNTRAWQLPPSLSQVEPVSGFAEAAESEGWTTGLLAPRSTGFVGGPQLAVSDDETLYWKEAIELGDEPETDPSNVLVRGYSLTESKTSVLYGNGSNAKKRCLIQTPSAGIATTGEKLVVFDYGPGEESTAFGNRVMTFGPGGSDCRSPVAKFTANGKIEGEEVTAEKGTEVTFDSSVSEALGLAATELVWDFGDGSEQKVTGSSPAKTVKHTFASAGTYEVTLRMKLEQATDTANFGNPLPVTRLVKVTGGSLAKLTVTKAGSGFGTVTGSPAGVACGSDCDQEFETGKEVTLTAKAAAGSKFSGWSGCASEPEGDCKVTMSAARAVTATFDPVPKQKLTVKKAGSGTGVVTSAPSGIDCRKDCTQEYEEGKEVMLKAVPVEGTNSTFTGWSGGGCSGTESCKVTMSAAKEVTATFVAGGTFAVEVEIAGNGGGTVASIPSGVLCPTAACSANFAKGQEVELVQGASEGSTFVKWGGACSGSGACKLTGEAGDVKKVTAEFESPGPFKLSVAKIGSGAGAGKVTSGPSGISCSPTCSAEFDKDEEVTLTATVTEGAEAEFVKWTGDCAGSEKTCKVTMSKAKSVTAEFKSTAVDKAQLKVNKTGTGTGKVTSSPAGVDCGSTCTFKFAKETDVELTAVADAGSEFVKWSGSGCSGTGICKVKMSADKEVTAEFKTTPKFKLTVKKAGAGSGKVTSSPAAIDCGGACEFEFEKNTKVVLSQSADSGSEFVKWTGACSGSGACEVTMGTAKTVTAEFKPAPSTSTPPPSTSTPPPSIPTTPTPTTPTPKLTPKQKALAKCKKKSGKARAKCIKKVKAKYKKRGSKRRRLKDSG